MIHHTALAVKDVRRAHDFYTRAMGFTLVKAVKRRAHPDGWTKHLFYDMGDGTFFAIWDVSGIEGVLVEADAWKGGLSTGVGLPDWINHIAFKCDNLEQLEAHRRRWLDHGCHVSEIVHEFIHSIYTLDSEGTTVEWTYDTTPLTAADADEAMAILLDDSPATDPFYATTFEKSTVPKPWNAVTSPS